MSAYDEQDEVLSRRLRELVRLAGAGELSDVSGEPGGPYDEGLHLSGRAMGPRGETEAQGRVQSHLQAQGHVQSQAYAEGIGQEAGEGHGLVPVAAHEGDGGGTGPREPDLPEGPHAPETPHAPDAPDLPESPDLPGHKAPQSPDLPDLPGVPEIPEVDGPTEMPSIPGAPDILQTPYVSPTPHIPPPPDIEDMPEIPAMPEIPDPPEIPETPGIYDEPSVPDPPRIDDPPEIPEADRPVELPNVPGDPTPSEAPDLPRPPDLPDAPPPAPGQEADRNSVTAMHSNSNQTDDSRSPDGSGRSGDETAPTRAADGADSVPVPVPVPVSGVSGGSGGSYGASGRGRGGGHGGTGGGGGHGDGTGGPGDSGGPGGFGDSEMEAELRRMLHRSVSDIEPAPESLTYLRHAVPARRAHRRRALVGAAAAVVLAGVGVPALFGTGLLPGLPGDTVFNAGGNHDQSQSAGGTAGAGGAQGEGDAIGGVGAGGAESGGGNGSLSPSPTQGSDSEGPGANDDLATSAPSCGRQQLGEGTVDEGSPGSDGKVYGSFRVVNTSTEACTVEGEGLVGASARGRADVERINVLDHTSGDAATGLPDPDLAASELVLKPGQAYEVKWAWVPSDCHGPGPKPKAEPPPGEDNGPGGGNGGEDGGPGGEDGGPGGGPGGPDVPATGGNEGDPGGGSGGQTDKKASVVLSHTPDVGDPATADTELEGACAGTLYRTGVLAAD